VIDTAVRATGIGGTDVAALVGVHPNKTAFDVYREKTGLDKAIERTENERMWAGKRLEKVIAEMYTERTGNAHEWADVTLPGRRPHQVFTPDAVIGLMCDDPTLALLDCKNVAWDQAYKWGEDGSADVPDHIALQMQWYLDADNERQFADIAAFFGGHELRVYRILPDREIQESLYVIAERFWREHVLAGVAPNIEYSDATAEWIRRRFPRGNGNMREATIEEFAIIEQFRDVHTEAAKAKKLKDTWALRVKNLIGEYDGLTVEGKPLVTNRQAKDSQETDWKSVSLGLKVLVDPAQWEAIIAIQTRTKTGSRRLLLKGEKDG
jgi:predicted phage-related endonuclease